LHNYLQSLFPAQLTSIYLTVLVSFERYVAICRPFQMKVWCTTKLSTILCISVTVLCCLYTLPIWFESTSRPVPLRSDNFTCYTGYIQEATDFVKNKNYKYYYRKWGTFFVFRFCPFIALLVFNGSIFKEVSKVKWYNTS